MFVILKSLLYNCKEVFYPFPKGGIVFMKKQVCIALVLLLLGSVLFAGDASVFDISIINNYRMEDVSDLNYEAYVPTLRLQANLNDWFGLSVGGMYDYLKYSDSIHRILIATEAVVRAPLGMVEPFLALGPVYTLTLDDPSDAYGFQGRLGLDVAVNSWFSLGLEGALVIPSLTPLVEGTETFTTDYLMKNLFVGLAFKAKF